MMTTNIRYIDFNRGNDANNGWTPQTPWKNLAMMANFDPGNSGGGGIFLACDSTWIVDQTLASSGSQTQSRFNGVAGNPAFITSYVPAGADATKKPTITRRLIPTPSDWRWDSTDNFGTPKGWYIQLAYMQSSWDILVEVNGAIAETTNQETPSNKGNGCINGQMSGVHTGTLVNGMTLDTLRFNFDISGANVAGSTNARVYLSGLGLRSPGVGNDPSSVVGAGKIVIAFGQMWAFYDSLNYVKISNIRAENGSGLVLYQGTADTVRQGFEMTGCETHNTCCPIRINSGTGSVATTKWSVDIYDNTFDTLTGPALLAYGIGVAGFYRRNTLTNGNLASSMGGGVYCQVKPSTVGGTRDPFRVEYNIADRWRNGAGNNAWDGGCYYADIQDGGTIWSHNIAKNSFVAYQCGSGSRSEWYGNISINCEYCGLFNSAVSPNDYQNYVFAHNLHIAAPRGTFSHGEDATVHPYTFTSYMPGDAAHFVGCRVQNNIFVNNPAQPNEVPLNLYRAAEWNSGNINADGNVFVGYGSRLVACDFNTVDKTASVKTTSAMDVKFSDSNYRIRPDSPAAGAGVPFASIAMLDDFDGRRYYDKPTAGPYEVQRYGQHFGPIWKGK